MIVKTIRRRTGKPSLGQDVTAVLAHLNATVSHDRRSRSLVSQNCLVTYLASPTDGLVSQFCGWDRATNKPALQHIAGGFDITSIVKAIKPISLDYATRWMEARKKGELFDEQMDFDAISESLRRSHKEPSDEFK